MEDKLLTASELTTEEQLQICQKSRDDYEKLCRTMEISNENLVDELRGALQAEKDKNKKLEEDMSQAMTFINKLHDDEQGDDYVFVWQNSKPCIFDLMEKYPIHAPQDNEMKEVE